MSQLLNFNQSEVMARVIFLHRLKRAVFSPWSHLVALGFLVVVTFSLVSALDVVANWWQAGVSYDYALDAIKHTELFVQLILAGLVLFFLVLAHDIFKTVKFHRHFATL